MVKCYQLPQVLSGEKEIGKNVVEIGAGHVGCETCFFMAEKKALRS